MCTELSGPEARRTVATGGAQRNPWIGDGNGFRPERAAGPTSVPQVFLIELNFVCAQEFQQLLPKCFQSMVFLLRTDVLTNLLDLRLADRKNRVAFLPAKVPEFRKCFVHPLRRVRFQIASERRDRSIGSPPKENVNVVANAANLQRLPALSSNDSTQILINARPDGVGQPRCSPLRAENKMELDVVVGARHDGSLFRCPFGANTHPCRSYPRVLLRFTRGYRPLLLRSTTCQLSAPEARRTIATGGAQRNPWIGDGNSFRPEGAAGTRVK